MEFTEIGSSCQCSLRTGFYLHAGFAWDWDHTPPGDVGKSYYRYIMPLDHGLKKTGTGQPKILSTLSVPAGSLRFHERAHGGRKVAGSPA